MNRIIALALAVALSACSKGALTAEQERITALEQENAQLREDLKKQKANVAALHAALSHGESAPAMAEEGEKPGQATVPQPMSPQPQGPTPQSQGGAESGRNGPRIM